MKDSASRFTVETLGWFKYIRLYFKYGATLEEQDSRGTDRWWGPFVPQFLHVWKGVIRQWL